MGYNKKWTGGTIALKRNYNGCYIDDNPYDSLLLSPLNSQSKKPQVNRQNYESCSND